MTRGQTGDVLCMLAQIPFAGLKHHSRFTRSFSGCIKRTVMPLARSGQFLRLALKALDRFLGIAVQPTFAVNIARQLSDAASQGLNQRGSARLLIAQCVALRGEPLQYGGRDRLFFAQRGQNGFRLLAALGHPAHLRLGLGCRRNAGTQFVFCFASGLIRLAPAAIQQQTLSVAQRLANLAIPRGVAGLAGQRRELRSQLFDHIINAGEVLLCTV